MELREKQVLVVGLGITGVALTRFLLDRGALVTITDRAAADDLKTCLSALAGSEVRLELGGHSTKTFERADLIILSPGVPEYISPVMRAMQKGIRILGEIELACRYIREPILAVTGTNGKTTTTSLLGEMMVHSGRKVFVGGNIGKPLIDYVTAGKKADAVIVEVSSFQLDTINTFRPNIGILLNITEDHLDRYRDLGAYAASKFRLFKNQQAGDTAVLNGADPLIRRLSGNVRAKKLFYSDSTFSGEEGGVIEDRQILVNLKERNFDPIALDLSDFGLAGKHNVENAAAASLAALAAGATVDGVQTALRCFKPLAHRMEYVGAVEGVKYINDSKATNVDSVARALESFGEPVILIMGGRDKGATFELLGDMIRRHVKKLILVGEAATSISAAIGHIKPVEKASSMQEAVRMSHHAAIPGDVVLLSPGCASFDMYKSYAHRGESFRKAVDQIKGRHT